MNLLIFRLGADPGPSTGASSDTAKQLEALERENAVLRSTVQCLAAYLPDDVAPEVVGVSPNGPPPSCLNPDKQEPAMLPWQGLNRMQIRSHGKAVYIDKLSQTLQSIYVETVFQFIAQSLQSVKNHRIRNFLDVVNVIWADSSFWAIATALKQL